MHREGRVWVGCEASTRFFIRKKSGTGKLEMSWELEMNGNHQPPHPGVSVPHLRVRQVRMLATEACRAASQAASLLSCKWTSPLEGGVGTRRGSCHFEVLRKTSTNFPFRGLSFLPYHIRGLDVVVPKIKHLGIL